MTRRLSQSALAMAAVLVLSATASPASAASLAKATPLITTSPTMAAFSWNRLAHAKTYDLVAADTGSSAATAMARPAVASVDDHGDESDSEALTIGLSKLTSPANWRGVRTVQVRIRTTFDNGQQSISNAQNIVNPLRPAVNTELRVGSFNVLAAGSSAPGSWLRREPAVKALIAASGADVIAAQELTKDPVTIGTTTTTISTPVYKTVKSTTKVKVSTKVTVKLKRPRKPLSKKAMKRAHITREFKKKFTVKVSRNVKLKRPRKIKVHGKWKTVRTITKRVKQRVTLTYKVTKVHTKTVTKTITKKIALAPRKSTVTKKITQRMDLNLAEALRNGTPYRVVNNPTPGGGRHGGRLIYNSSTVTLKQSGGFAVAASRYVSWAKFVDKSSGRDFIAVSVHLSPNASGASSRRTQTTQIISKLKVLYTAATPLVLGGDFNSGSTKPPYLTMIANGFFDTRGAVNIHPATSDGTKLTGTTSANAWIDYIFTKGSPGAYSYTNVQSLNGVSRKSASDHAMQLATVGLPSTSIK